MTKLHLREIMIEFPKRASILTYTKPNIAEVHLADKWLDEWAGHYKVVGVSGCEDAFYDLSILCTNEAYDKLPSDIRCSDDWEEKGILVWPLSQEEYIEQNAPIDDTLCSAQEDQAEPVTLKVPLTLTEKDK